MEGILELQRRTHEVIDHLEEAIVDALIMDARTHKAKLVQEHYVNSLLDKMVESALRLDQLYKDDIRQDELASVTVEDTGDATGDFYDQLKSIKDRHRRLETTIEDIVETEAFKSEALLSDEELAALFSGEEILGRFLDLHEPYEQYINLKDVKKIDYLRYIEQVDNFLSVPVATKQSSQYASYIKSLLDYLEDYFRRSRPLLNLGKLKINVLDKFEKDWKAAKILGWEELASKESADLFCVACNKQFYNPSVFKAHLSGKKHIKAEEAAKGAKSADRVVDESSKWAKETAKIEALISSYLEVLGKIREDTRAHIEAKQTRNYSERAVDLELEEEEQAAPVTAEELEKDDYDPKIYNPLNLPLDWDGKPIPYWLWKLHGLGTRYPCEICGNHVYMGRKAFDQHFYEWRHAHSLKCLGIPNIRCFYQVTTIKDALDLWEKVKQQTKAENFRPEVMEEIEDQHGNVYSRKTYEDLKRQGLI